jgi:hypothetical protein
VVTPLSATRWVGGGRSRCVVSGKTVHVDDGVHRHTRADTASQCPRSRYKRSFKPMAPEGSRGRYGAALSALLNGGVCESCPGVSTRDTERSPLLVLSPGVDPPSRLSADGSPGSAGVRPGRPGGPFRPEHRPALDPSSGAVPGLGAWPGGVLTPGQGGGSDGEDYRLVLLTKAVPTTGLSDQSLKGT